MSQSAEDIRSSLEGQIAELKREMGRVTRMAAGRASDAMSDAEDVFETGKGRARHVARQLQDRAQLATTLARENPGTTATALATAGLLGLAAGFLLGHMVASDER